MELDDFSSNGLQGEDEIVLLGALSTDSGASANEYDFTIRALGYKAGVHYSNSLTMVKTDLSPITQDVSILTNFKKKTATRIVFKLTLFPSLPILTRVLVTKKRRTC